MLIHIAIESSKLLIMAKFCIAITIRSEFVSYRYDTSTVPTGTVPGTIVPVRTEINYILIKL